MLPMVIPKRKVKTTLDMQRSCSSDKKTKQKDKQRAIKGGAGLRPTITEIAGQMLFPVSSEQLDLASLGRRPGIWRIRDLTVVDVLTLAPPQAMPLFLSVTVSHVATPVCQEAEWQTLSLAVSMTPPTDTYPFLPRCPPPPPQRSTSPGLSAISLPCAGFWWVCVCMPLLLFVSSGPCYPRFQYHCQHLHHHPPHHHHLPRMHQNLHPLSFWQEDMSQIERQKGNFSVFAVLYYLQLFSQTKYLDEIRY